MSLLDYFRRRPDFRCEPAPDVAQIERDIEARLAKRKAARTISCPYKRGHATRAINRSV
jgi:hypothetical protein